MRDLKRILGEHRKGIVFVISAPSGAGKTTLTKGLVRRFPDLSLSVSYTTRVPRAGEKPGSDYHFVKESVFRRMLQERAFAEWAEVHGNFYGTERRVLERRIARGRDVLLDIDVQGAKKIKGLYRNAVSIFLVPPSLRELERRLASRGTDQRDVIRRRLIRAKRELEEIRHYDYAVVNRQVDQALSALSAILMAERLKVARRTGRGAQESR